MIRGIIGLLIVVAIVLFLVKVAFLGGIVGLIMFAALETRTRTPLLNVRRLRERGVGGGFLMMLTASSVLFGTFLLTSMYLQGVLGTGPMETGLAFLPIAITAGVSLAAMSAVSASARAPRRSTLLTKIRVGMRSRRSARNARTAASYVRTKASAPIAPSRSRTRASGDRH